MTAHWVLFTLLASLLTSSLPNHTELLVSVLADEAWVQGEGESLDLVRELMTESITSTRSEHVSMEIDFRSLGSGNISDIDLSGSSVVVTLTDCAATQAQ